MPINQDPSQLGYRGNIRSRAHNLIVKTLAVAGAGVMLVSAVVVSVVFFAVALAALIAVGGYLWWKTRHLRKQMRTHRAHGEVIEGVVIRDADIQQPPKRLN